MAQQEVTIRATELRLIALPPMTLLGSAMTAAVAVVILWFYLDHSLVLGWAAGMSALFALRLAMAASFRRIAEDDEAVTRWFWPLTVSAALGGVLWGLFGVSFYLLDDVEIRGVVLLVLASMLASGTIFYAPALLAHGTYVFGCALPIAAASFWHGSPSSTLFGVVTFMYIALILRAAQAFNRNISNAIRLQLENASLVTGLKRAKEAAEEANRTKSHFLAAMSHELRTPLNAVIGYSEMLLEDAESEGRADQSADLKRIHTAGRHLLSLVNDVLDLSKIEAGRMEVMAVPIDFAGFIDEVVATATSLVGARDNTLEVVGRGAIGQIVGDATKLRQILLNLLSNAAKFTEHGRITLTATREQRGDGEWIAIAVTDTGIGISREALARLFTNFTQADAATSSKYGGTGLGLALSQKLCALMGGEITAESEPGRGSCFTMRVPATLVPGSASRAESRVSEPRGGDGMIEPLGLPKLSLP